MDGGETLYTNTQIELIHSYKYLFYKKFIEVISSIILVLLTVFIFKEKIWIYPIIFIIMELIGFGLYQFINIVYKNIYKLMPFEKKKDYLTDNLNNLIEYKKSICPVEQINFMVQDAIQQTEYVLEQLKEVSFKCIEKEDTEIKSYIETLKIFKQSIRKFKDVKKDLFNDITKKLDELLDLVKNDNQKKVFTHKIFNIYLPEIIMLLNKDVDISKISMLLKELNCLIDDTIKMMDKIDNKNNEITIEVLKKEIKQNRQELRSED